MNTQTHLLMATAVLLPLAPVLTRQRASRTHGTPRIPPGAASRPEERASGTAWVIAALIGALAPDASLFVMFFIAKAQGVPESIIFSEWYFSEFWQRLGAITNSIPIYAALAVVAYCARWPLITGAALAALMHCITDLPLHHDDGHPHFWPFSDWIYASPVSYWDPSHYGNQWGLFELALAVLMIVFLWRRSANRMSRVLLVLAGLSYAVVAFFWFTAFG